MLHKLRGLSREEGVTLFMTLLCAFNVLLNRYSAQADIVVGIPVSGRSRAEFEGMVWQSRCGDLAKAKELLSRMSAVIVRDKQIHEVYGRNGEPMASIWYKPEAPLTWNAGMFIYASKYFEEMSMPASKPAHTNI